MKPHLTAVLTTLMLLAGGAAVAADMSSSKRLPPAPELPAFYSWTGAYLGIQGGYAWDSGRIRQAPGGGFGGLLQRYDSGSGLVGAQAGLNYQFGGFVLGVEGDVEALQTRSDLQGFSILGRTERDWQASVRGRIGYAFDRFMVFGTGGAAFTEFHQRFDAPPAGSGDGARTTRTGWTAGGGVNYAFTDNLILGADYRYTSFGKLGYVARSGLLGLASEQEPRMHTVRASVAYKF